MNFKVAYQIDQKWPISSKNDPQISRKFSKILYLAQNEKNGEIEPNFINFNIKIFKIFLLYLSLVS